MPLENYGVLKGRPITSRLGAGRSPHYQVHIVDDTTDYRIAVNVRSRLFPSELLYLVDERFDHPLLDELVEFPQGFTELDRRPGGVALDYIRGNLLSREAMTPLAHDIPGPDNDLNEKIDRIIQRALADEEAMVYAFGERWGPEPDKRDKHFGFLPGNGIHDIHMNQGNHEDFKRDDGVWQDGGLLIHFPVEQRWVGIFLAFQSQAWHTDDVTGHAIASPGETPGGDGTQTADGRVRIVAALVNPAGHDVGLETVTLVNTTPGPIDLDGWAIADRNNKREVLQGPVLEPGQALTMTLSGAGAQLSNRGGTITLLDPADLKVDGVAYTRTAARRQGWTLVF